MPAAVVESIGVRRLLVSAFVHADNYHLYYNLSSLLWVGTALEKMNGSKQYLKLLAVLVPASHALFVAISSVLWAVLGVGKMYYSSTLGFSATLFAMKVVLARRLPRGMTNIFGFHIKMTTAIWLELLLYWLLLPSTAVSAHLSGVLAGLLYIHGWGFWAYLKSALQPRNLQWNLPLPEFLRRWLGLRLSPQEWGPQGAQAPRWGPLGGRGGQRSGTRAGGGCAESLS